MKMWQLALIVSTIYNTAAPSPLNTVFGLAWTVFMVVTIIMNI